MCTTEASCPATSYPPPPRPPPCSQRPTVCFSEFDLLRSHVELWPRATRPSGLVSPHTVSSSFIDVSVRGFPFRRLNNTPRPHTARFPCPFTGRGTLRLTAHLGYCASLPLRRRVKSPAARKWGRHSSCSAPMKLPANPAPLGRESTLLGRTPLGPGAEASQAGGTSGQFLGNLGFLSFIS